MNPSGTNYSDLRQRINNYRSQLATQKARTEQAQAQLLDIETRIVNEYKVLPENLEAEIVKIDSEVNGIVEKINQHLALVNF